MATHDELARALFPRNPSELGGDSFKWNGKTYIITTGTGDGNYAYLEKDVRKWLDSLDLDRGEAADYDDFVQAVDAQTSKELAKAVSEEMDTDLYDGGTRIRFARESLRASLIRLAHAKPQLRAALLPLLEKQAEYKVSPADKKVLDAFIDKTPADSKKLTTDGKTLDGNWMGGKGIAVWGGGKIQLVETGGKSAQTIHRAIRKMAPRNMVASSQAVVAKRMARSFIRKLARMSDEARELELFIENDGQLYRQQHAPIIQNLTRKWNKGQYDFALSIKLFMYLADAGAKKYQAELGTSGVPWNKAFPKATRMEVAKSLAESFRVAAEAGEYT